MQFFPAVSARVTFALLTIICFFLIDLGLLAGDALKCVALLMWFNNPVPHLMLLFGACMKRRTRMDLRYGNAVWLDARVNDREESGSDGPHWQAIEFVGNKGLSVLPLDGRDAVCGSDQTICRLCVSKQPRRANPCP
jgi:hypothetical protein